MIERMEVDGCTKASWIIDKGVWLGRKAVITGAVVSSAPLLLPPLVVLSTLGLACSVPFGFVFATYACTQNIMSKLLPTPDPSPMLDYSTDDVDYSLQPGYVEDDDDDDDFVQRAEEQGYEEDGAAQVKLEQVPEEQEMKDTPAQGDNLQEKQIDTLGFGVTSMELDGRNNVLPEGAALSKEDVFYGQDGIQIYNEQPLEQEKLMLDVLKGTGMENMLDDAITSLNIHKQSPVVEEIQFKELVEGASRMIELNVNDISDPERGHSYQARVCDEKNGFAVLKKESDEIKKETLIGNDIYGEDRNETQESTSQANEIYAHKNVKERPLQIIEHIYEGGNKEDTTKYLQVEDALSVEETQVRNEKLIIEDMNEKPVVEMRQVIVSVHCGKKIADEQTNEDIEDSQKLVLVAKKVTEETVGDIKSVVESNTLGDLNSAREIADECGLDLCNYAAGDHDSYNDFNLSQENDNIRSSETDDVSNLPVLRVSTKVAKSKHMNLQPETDPITPSNEVLLNEENIWEQIEALRAIVGYSAPAHTTSAEEIKALYIFTGVEPPASLADNTDLVEMNEKLRLLKSVVGVK